MTYVVYYKQLGIYHIDTFTEEEFEKLFADGALHPSESWMLI